MRSSVEEILNELLGSKIDLGGSVQAQQAAP